jgi:hypothetical protein
MDLFNIDKEGNIVFDIEGYKAIPTILTIIRRGTQKERSSKELRYVWYIFDFNSPGNRNAFKGAELIKEAKAFADLPSDWQADGLVNDCINECLKYYGGGTIRYAKKLLEGLEDSKRIVGILVEKNSQSLEDLNLLPNVTKEDRAERKELIKDVIEAQKQIVSLADTLPKTISVVEKSIADALRSLGEMKNDIWGGRTLGNRED